MKTHIEITNDDLRYASHVPGHRPDQILERALTRAGLTGVVVYPSWREAECDQGAITKLPPDCCALLSDEEPIEPFGCDIQVLPWLDD